ncbi:RNA polymerase sigma factor [Larkinella rosea]|uniref:Sigma-70 family RNA polymerase sigma factor n=1 Tax=Larkinella rosea TaxID=2025312 RepID=A0A3P1BPA3_9BACT|nr:sigma-70 family RNA polymerase sigma factor [Larkinella rosea]RRB02878.1 sigma-70 family RNA polymerase sigma factor [Larkinella rosea]
MNCMCEDSLLESLRAGDTSAYEWVYKKYYPSIARFVQQNKGNEGDAEDIFQESVLVLYQKITAPDFRLTSTLKTFLFSIAKHSWLKKLRDEKLVPISEEQLILIQDTQDFVSDDASPEEGQHERLNAWMARITGHCQRVIKSIYFSHEPMDNLMVTMGWKNRHTAVNQKYKCIQQLKRVSEAG